MQYRAQIFIRIRNENKMTQMHVFFIKELLLRTDSLKIEVSIKIHFVMTNLMLFHQVINLKE